MSLSYLDLSYNALTGALPGEWLGMSQLKELNVGANQLRGSLPSSWPSGSLAVTLQVPMYVGWLGRGRGSAALEVAR